MRPWRMQPGGWRNVRNRWSSHDDQDPRRHEPLPGVGAGAGSRGVGGGSLVRSGRSARPLEEPIRIDSYCHHCGETIEIRPADEAVQSARPASTIVYLALPAAKWWENIVLACANTRAQ